MRRLWQEQRGNIYIEALVAVAILVVALAPILGGFAMTPAVQEQSGRRLAALNIARGRLESLHALSGPAWDGLDTTAPAPDPRSPDYAVRLTVTPRPGLTDLKDVTVTVGWADNRGRSHTLDLTTSVARRP